MNGVDVVVPCYNYARFLEQCVSSVLTQEGVEVRVLIIDDASSDETPEIGKRLAAADRRVEYRRHAVNRGHIATYNEGLLGWASAEYALLLSADDALAPASLARAAQLMDSHKEVGMTYGMAFVISGHECLPTLSNLVSEDYQIISSSEFLRYCLTRGNPVPTPTAIVRTALQHRVGGYREDLPHSGDMEMWMRFAVHAPVGVVRAVQAYYRWHGRNMGDGYYERPLGDMREVLLACTEVVARWGERFPESHNWLAATTKGFAENAAWLASKAFDEGDLGRCRTCLEFARDLSPRLWKLNAWRRYSVKALLGRRLWSAMRPAINRLRRVEEEPSGSSSRRYQRVGEERGWWPPDLRGSPLHR